MAIPSFLSHFLFVVFNILGSSARKLIAFMLLACLIFAPVGSKITNASGITNTELVTLSAIPSISLCIFIAGLVQIISDLMNCSLFSLPLTLHLFFTLPMILTKLGTSIDRHLAGPIPLFLQFLLLLSISIRIEFVILLQFRELALFLFITELCLLLKVRRRNCSCNGHDLTTTLFQLLIEILCLRLLCLPLESNLFGAIGNML
mmetsp:Transcript_10772/g.26042  ORF Transcript_10772/g.26042 Transcript_10772/m.26042 type:complete len:204 (+) Transcript_10772:949-1560(+)